jgi:hypothetical protein
VEGEDPVARDRRLLLEPGTVEEGAQLDAVPGPEAPSREATVPIAPLEAEPISPPFSIASSGRMKARRMSNAVPKARSERECRSLAW